MHVPNKVRRHRTRLHALCITLQSLAMVALIASCSVEPGVRATQEQHGVAAGIQRAFFVGDSYTAGTPIGGAGARNYSQILASAYSFSANTAARGGSGYVKPGPRSRPFEAEQLPALVSNNPDLVIIVGSRNDGGQRPEVVGAAATHLYESIRTALPRVRMLVVGPIWTDEAPPRRVLATRDAVRGAAIRQGIPFIDPIREAWFTSSHPELIASDGVHPTDEGHEHMASRMSEAMISLNLLQGLPIPDAI